ncbi:MAG: methionine adenosyltransferase [Deltaproteobacteria bacterium]|nr:methionine adenosyltransferase [Deltaproteobacteria bacterium]
MELFIRAREGAPVDQAPVEIVERKGLGHPDSICDALAEATSVALCRHYRARYGTILHHNVDKVLLSCGASRPAFRGGEVLAPITIDLAGRVTSQYRGERIPVAEIAIEACRRWLFTHLRCLEARQVVIVPRFSAGSNELTGLFARGEGRTPHANDTSCGAGFALRTDLERVVLTVERALNSPGTKREHPALGEDVKVMGVRRRSRIELTLGCAMIDRFLDGFAAYQRAKAIAVELALEAARRETHLEVGAVVNAADDLERGEIFLTVTGTSAEAGDDGEAGRGNRTSGLITPYRPMTLEAAAGKNPVSHVGKLYNLLAGDIASEAVKSVPGVLGADCFMVSRIGRPIDQPEVVDARLTLAAGADIRDLTAPMEALIRDRLARLPELLEGLLEERIPVY